MAVGTMADKNVTIRIPEDLHAKLVEFAAKDLRSLNSYILKALIDRIAEEERKQRQQSAEE